MPSLAELHCLLGGTPDATRCGQRRQRTRLARYQTAMGVTGSGGNAPLSRYWNGPSWSPMAELQSVYTDFGRHCRTLLEHTTSLTLSATPTATRPLTRSQLPSPSRTRRRLRPMCLTRQPFRESPSPLLSMRAAAATHPSAMPSAGVLDG